MANRTTLVDNNTWNNSHIALVGKAMSSTEDKAYKIMRMLGVDYVLVIFGGMIGYSGDDINKFLWMVRIAEGEHPQDIKVCMVCTMCSIPWIIYLYTSFILFSNCSVVSLTCTIVIEVIVEQLCFINFRSALNLCFSLIFAKLQESNYFTPQGEFRVDSGGSSTLLNCLMYKLAYFRFGEVQVINIKHAN